MLRVAHICEQMVIGGISSLLRDLLNAMNGKDFEFKVIYFYGEGNFVEEIRNLGIEVENIMMKKALRIDPVGLIKLWRQLWQFNPDVLHCHGPYPLLAALLLKAFFKEVPVIYTFHGTFHAGEQKSDPVIRRALRRCDTIVAVSKAGATALKNFSRNDAPITFIHNGIDLQRMGVSREFIKNKKKFLLGFTDKEQIVLSVAQFNADKCHINLLKAFHKIREVSPQARLYLIGDGPSKGEVEEMIKQLSLCNVVKLGGLRSDIAELMAISDLFVLSSLTEGLPITLLEASAAGLPFIATAVGGIPEIYEAGVPCYIVPPHDHQALYDAISLLLRDEKIRKNMGDQAKETVRLKFNISSTAKKYAELYKNVIQQFKS